MERRRRNVRKNTIKEIEESGNRGNYTIDKKSWSLGIYILLIPSNI